MNPRRWIILFTLLIAFGGWAWWIQKTDALSRWQADIIQAAINQIRGKLPFEIESVKVKKTWRELLSGRIANVELVLRRDRFRMVLSGPVDLTERKLPTETLMRVTYDPSIEASLEMKRLHELPPISAHLEFEATRTFTQLRSLEFKTNPVPSWEFKPLGLKIAAPALMARWRDSLINLEVGVNSAEWSPPHTQSKTVMVTGLKLEAQTVAAELSTQLGFGRWTGQLAAKTGEVLWGELYLDLPLKELPFGLEFELGSRQAGVTVGQTRADRPAPLAVRADWNPEWLLHWTVKTTPIALSPLIAAAKKAAPTLWPAEGWEFRGGTARLSGSGHLQLPTPVEPIKSISGDLKLEGVSVRNAAKALAVSGLDLSVKTDLPRGQIRGALGIGSLRFKKVRGQLASTEFKADRSKDGESYSIQIGQYLELPLRLEGLPLKISSLRGHWLRNPSKEEDAPTKYQAMGSLRLENTPLSRLLEMMCLPTRFAPPAQVSAHFPKIEFTESSIDPTGTVRTDLFSGFVEADELGLFDYLSEVPELDFSVRFSGIRLDQLGDWLQFGEMDGTLEGHALDVTFQSWLPTHYDALFEARPRSHSDVVFSPDAMKNFARLATSDGIDNLPGIIDWIAFGWPRRMLGGYDVDYVGLSLLSDSGFIQVKTLDPPAILAKEQKHFILYSDRFKMPLETNHYPLIIQAGAISNYVRRLFLSFSPKEMPAKGTTPDVALPEDCIPQ